MYIRDDKEITIGSKIILSLLVMENMITDMNSFRSIQRAIYPEVHRYYASRRFEYQLKGLIKKGWIKTEGRGAKKILKLTKKGELEAIFAKAFKTPHLTWDTTWTVVIFDIPEAAKEVRHKLRYLLKRLSFKPLQASVWISPYPLNASAEEYLVKAKLNKYIRILHVDKIDNDKDVRKAFKLRV